MCAVGLHLCDAGASDASSGAPLSGALFMQEPIPLLQGGAGCVCLCVCVSVHMSESVCVSMFVHVCVCVCVYVCTHVCVYDSVCVWSLVLPLVADVPVAP